MGDADLHAGEAPASREMQTSAELVLGQAKAAATEAQGHADVAQSAVQHAQEAVAQAGLDNEPSWIYAMVIGVLGAALLILTIAMVIIALRGRNIPNDVVSAVTLILGGLIGILAPTPATKRRQQKP